MYNEYNGFPVTLPTWFVQGRDAKLNRISILQHIPIFIRNIAAEKENSILEEMKSRLYYKAQARKNYSSTMISYALLLRYTSLQSYKLLLEKFPLPSISLLNK